MFRYLLLIAALTLLPVAASAADQSLYLVTDDWPPYEYRDPETGRITGLSTEIIEAVLERMALAAPRISLLPWARAQREVMSGQADAIYTISPSRERLRSLHYPAEALAKESGVLFTQSGRGLKVESVSDLKPLTIGVIRGYAYSPELWHALESFGNFSALTDEEQLFRMLALGRVDAVISYRSVGVNMIERLGLQQQLALQDKIVLFESLFYIAFSKQRVDGDFVARFSEALHAFKQEPAYLRLLRKYGAK